MRYLLDTSICVAATRGRSPALLDRLARVAIGDLGISAIALGELETGISLSAQGDANRATLTEFLSNLTPLDWPVAATRRFGEIWAELERKGQRIGSMDLLIGVHALHLNATLVTNNEREFRRIPGLKVENWLKA